MKTNSLSKFTTKQLLKELESRKGIADLSISDAPTAKHAQIKKSSKKFKLAAQLIVDNYCEEAKEKPYIMLGILGEDGKFLDFYYNSNLEYEEFQKFIPQEFCEVMESTYELKTNLTKEAYIKAAFDILSKCGYKRVADFVE